MVIPFDSECRARYYGLLDKVFDSNMWSDGAMQKIFEKKKNLHDTQYSLNNFD